MSSGSRVTTFLSTVNRYSVHVRHIAGIENLPSDLSQDTRPSKTATKIVRYLQAVVIAPDGLLVVQGHTPFQPPRDRIVVPCSVLDGLFSAIHIRFNYPSKYQTKRLFNRHFFALDLDKAIDAVFSSCHVYQSLKTIPKHLHPQSTTEAPRSIGVSFATDVARSHRQLIVVLRKTVSSYTVTSIIENENLKDLGNAIIGLSASFPVRWRSDCSCGSCS